MKYVVNAMFNVGDAKRARGGSILQQNVKRNIKDQYFNTGYTYSIYNIRPTDGKIVYSFIKYGDDNIKTLFEVEFNSTQEADLKIDHLTGVV